MPCAKPGNAYNKPVAYTTIDWCQYNFNIPNGQYWTKW